MRSKGYEKWQTCFWSNDAPARDSVWLRFEDKILYIDKSQYKIIAMYVSSLVPLHLIIVYTVMNEWCTHKKIVNYLASWSSSYIITRCVSILRQELADIAWGWPHTEEDSQCWWVVDSHCWWVVDRQCWWVVDMQKTQGAEGKRERGREREKPEEVQVHNMWLDLVLQSSVAHWCYNCM